MEEKKKTGFTLPVTSSFRQAYHTAHSDLHTAHVALEEVQSSALRIYREMDLSPEFASTDHFKKFAKRIMKDLKEKEKGYKEKKSIFDRFPPVRYTEKGLMISQRKARWLNEKYPD